MQYGSAFSSEERILDLRWKLREDPRINGERAGPLSEVKCFPEKVGLRDPCNPGVARSQRQKFSGRKSVVRNSSAGGQCQGVLGIEIHLHARFSAHEIAVGLGITEEFRFSGR